MFTARLGSPRVVRRRVLRNLDPTKYRFELIRNSTQGSEDPRAFVEYEREEPEEQGALAEELAYSEWAHQLNEHSERHHTEYISPIPTEILEVVRPFGECHWYLLNLAGRCPGSLDLMTSNPALAMAVSSLWAFREKPPQWPLRTARSLIGKRQEAIAGWLGFPESKSTVKILRKLPPSQCSVYTLLALRNLFSSHLKTLQHLPLLSEAVINLLAQGRGRYRLSHGVLEDIINDKEYLKYYISTIQNILWMRERLSDTGTIRVDSCLQLTELYDKCTEQIGRPDLKRLDRSLSDSGPFPEPPLLPSPDIELEPLRTEVDLLEEGRIQRNCVGSYGSRVKKGGVYVYRLLWPERATLSVELSESGKWGLLEIKSFANEPVSVKTVSAVLDWIKFAGSMSFYECDEKNVPF